MISISSVVIDACRVRLYSSVSLPSMSFAFFVEFSIDCILEPSSEVLFSSNALYRTAPILNSARSRSSSERPDPSNSYSSNLLKPLSEAFSYSSTDSTVATVGLKDMTD